MSYRRRYSPPAANSTSCVPRSTSRPSASTTIKSAWRTVARRCEHDDQVCVAHRREAVCDHEHRAVRHQAVDRLLYEALGLGVEGAGRLVEDQERWIAQQRPRDRDALALPAGEPRAALAQQGVVGLRELGDELVRVRGAGGAAYLLEREVTTAVRDVRIHRVVEQHGLL